MELFFIAIVCAALLDSAISALWVQYYFKYGIPIFRSSLYCVTAKNISSEWLNNHYDSKNVPPLLFKRFSENVIAVREKQFGIYGFHYPLVMHGVICQKSEINPALLVGYLNCFPLVFIVVSLYIFKDPSFMVFTLLFLGIPYSIQFVRFIRLARLIQEEFEN